MEELIQVFSDLPLSEQHNLLHALKETYKANYDAAYRLVYVYSTVGNGNISNQIASETGYGCYHVPSSNGGIGTNVIEVPRAAYTDAIRKHLEEAMNKQKVRLSAFDQSRTDMPMSIYLERLCLLRTIRKVGDIETVNNTQLHRLNEVYDQILTYEKL